MGRMVNVQLEGTALLAHLMGSSQGPHLKWQGQGLFLASEVTDGHQYSFQCSNSTQQQLSFIKMGACAELSTPQRG